MSPLDSVIQDPARVALVRELGVLNSPVHRPLDELTRVAASAVQAPVASISLLDGEHEHFVTVHGVPARAAGLRRCPVERSICRLTVAGGEPVRIADLREDPRFGASIDLGGLEIVAYLGVPLRMPGGGVVGSLCVIDERPRDWSQPDGTVLTELAASIVSFLTLRSQVVQRVLHDPVTGVPGETLFIARCDATRNRHTEGRSAMYRIEPGIGRSLHRPAARGTVLRRAAQLLAESVGSTDVLGRLTDGAFAVFAHALRDERDALRIAARIRGALSASGRGEPGHAEAPRIGIALTDTHTESAAELLRRAEHVIRGAAHDGAVTEIARRVA